jgi:hypothetical protein
VVRLWLGNQQLFWSRLARGVVRCHHGEIAGIGRLIAKHGWITYLYHPGDTMTVLDADKEPVKVKPRWNCTQQTGEGATKAVSCQQVLYVCEVDASAAKSNPALAAIYAANQTGWLMTGAKTNEPDSRSTISKALKASVPQTEPQSQPESAAPAAAVKVGS